MKIFFAWILISNVFAQVPQLSLKDVSQNINKTLPEIYDSITKLRTTTVENNHVIFHFLVDAKKDEFDFALPKVKTQVLGTICSQKREASIFKLQGNVVYRYESVKGHSLGEFMVRPDFCR